MAFFQESYLITVGVQGENSVAIWNLKTKAVEKSALLGHYAVNQIKVDPNVSGSTIQFITVGNNAAFTLWRYNIENQEVLMCDIGASEELSGTHFLSLDFTEMLEKQPINKYDEPSFVTYAIVGTSDGQLLPFDMNENKFDTSNSVKKITNG